MSHHHTHDHDTTNAHKDTVWQELVCHFPYAVFSVAFALILISFVPLVPNLVYTAAAIKKQTHTLFHSFHFMHIVFASAGAMITYLRFCKRLLPGIIISTISPAFFCILSDAILPYIGGTMLGVHMHWHICFITELHNVLPFLFIGIITGLALSYHGADQQGLYSIFSHFFHILISSIASTFYLVSHGFTDWADSIGYVFIFLVFAVVVPCTCSDVIVPMLFARAHKRC